MQYSTIFQSKKIISTNTNQSQPKEILSQKDLHFKQMSKSNSKTP